MLSVIVAMMLAGLVEFYKTFVVGADDALNGKHRHVQMHIPPTK